MGLLFASMAVVLVLLRPADVVADDAGLRGTHSKVSTGLASLLTDYEAHVQTAQAGEPFVPDLPAIRVVGGRVVIDAVASGDTNALLADLQGLGLQQGSAYGRVVSGLLPITAIGQLDAVDSLKATRPAYMLTNVGLVTSQGDAAMSADIARSIFLVDGTGVMVGTLSDSYDCLGGAAADVGTDDLPSGIVVLQELDPCNGVDEGRAMMQIIHDVAPGAAQAFHTAFMGSADFANGIIELATVAGAGAINDDVIYLAEPMFQDGIIAQAVDIVVNNFGVSYFSAAGNNGRSAYESAYNGVPPLEGFEIYNSVHDFDPGAPTDVLQRFTLAPGGALTVVLQWDQPFFSVGGSSAQSNYDLYLLDVNGAVVAASFDDNINVTGDAVEITGVFNGGESSVFVDVLVAEFDPGTPSPLGPFFKMVFFGFGFTLDEFDTASGTIYGHAGAEGAEAIGAAAYFQTPAFGVVPPVLESFSSPGPVSIFFDADGLPLDPPDIRDKPEVVGPDGGNNTFFGFDFEPDGFPNFFGTSAAAPHVAGVAALMLEAEPLADPGTVYSALEMTAIDMGVPGFDEDSGYGLVQADAALEYLNMPMPIPSLTTWGLVAMAIGFGLFLAVRRRRRAARA